MRSAATSAPPPEEQTPMDALLLIADGSTSATDNPGLHTLILGLIMVVGTAVAIWLFSRMGGR